MFGVQKGSEAVNFKLFLLSQVNFDQKGDNIFPLITLQLNHFTIFWVVNNSPITGELLFTSSDNFLLIVMVAYPLDCGQSLPTTALLYPDVNESLLVTLIVGSVCVSKWVKLLKILYIAHNVYRSMMR